MSIKEHDDDDDDDYSWRQLHLPDMLRTESQCRSFRRTGGKPGYSPL